MCPFLYYQLNGAPRIYAKKLHQDYEDLDMKYFKDNPNDQWIRSVDFTPSYCIGQSSAICLELPYGCQLPDYRKCVASYKVRIGNLILQTSSALSCYHDLVPIVDSPPSVDLPYSILFKINLLVQHGRLSWPTLDEDFYKLVDSSQTNSHLIQYALNQLFHLKEICYEPSKLLKKYTTSETDKPPPRESLDSGFVYVHKVMITPCKVYFCGPELIMSNLVLRNHREDIDNFLRVSFVDEDLNKLHLADVPTPGRCTSSAFQIRYGGYKGIVADDVFKEKQRFCIRELEATLNDPLKAQNALDLISSGEITNILKELLSCGYEPNVEPFVAMMLRTFKEVQLMELRTKTRILIPDGRSLMGCLDETGTLEYGQVFLRCMDTGKTQRIPYLTQGYGYVQNTCGYAPDTYPNKGIRSLLPRYAYHIVEIRVSYFYDTFQAKSEDNQKKKSNRSAQNLENVENDHGTLWKYVKKLERVENGRGGSVFQCNYCQKIFKGSYSRVKHSQFFYDSVTLSGKRFIVEEQVVVGKSPCLHPGDVRGLMAVDVLALHHMVDCVVFPQKEPRPHPDECSGSDLDGDIYFVSWDPELIRPRKFPPMDYSPMQTKELDHEFTVEVILLDNYVCCGKYGTANLKLDYPDFMEKPNKYTYESSGVIGVLYRDLKDIALHDSSITPFTFEISKKSYDPDMEVDGFEYYLEDAHRYKSIYDDKLRSLMEFYGIKTEAELLGTSFMRMPKYPDKSWNIKSVDVAVRPLWKEVRGWFDERGTSLDAGADDNLFAKASAWYCATYHPTYFGKYNAGEDHNHFISFPWCVYDKLIDIKKRCSTL
ncbi:hypothetical protein PS1_047567 [Malus domestica]